MYTVFVFPLMLEPRTFAVWNGAVLEWDEWDPRVVLGDLAWFLDSVGAERVKLRVMRKKSYWSRRRSRWKSMVVVTDVPHMYTRRVVEEVFSGWHVERVVDGFLLVRHEVFLRELELMEEVEGAAAAAPRLVAER
jgi:hypothetical protein